MEKTFTLESLLSDSSFRGYALHEDSDSIRKWTSIYDQSDGEQKKLIDTASQLLSELTEEDPHTSSAQEAVWQSISKNLKEKSTRRSTIIPLMRWAAAAVVLLAIGFFWVRGGSTVTVKSSGDIVTHVLPDGSEVELNAESSIRYNKRDWKTERALDLSGEAFFSVVKGSSFTVKSSVGEVNVLGTSFTVFDRDDRMEVKCFTGRVSVTNGFGEVILTPGELVDLSPSSETLHKEVFNKEQSDWREGIFRFENESLDIVLNELARQYQVKINAGPEVRNLLYTGFFEKNDLNQALYSICWPLNLHSVVSNNVVTIETDQNE